MIAASDTDWQSRHVERELSRAEFIEPAVFPSTLRRARWPETCFDGLLRFG